MRRGRLLVIRGGLRKKAVRRAAALTFATPPSMAPRRVSSHASAVAPLTYSRSSPAPLHLLVEWYADPAPARLAELRSAFMENLGNEHFADVRAFGSIADLARLPDHKRLVKVPSPQRMTFARFFDYASGNLSGTVCVIANADIYFDDSLGMLATVDLEQQMLTLTRWDVQADGRSVFLGRPDSADAWVFRPPVSIPRCEFHLGKPGCDNRIAYLADEAGYIVSNPSLTVVAHHLHLSGQRNYRPADRVQGPYLQVHPSKLTVT